MPAESQAICAVTTGAAKEVPLHDAAPSWNVGSTLESNQATNVKSKPVLAIVALVALFANRGWAPPPLTALTYQGRLTEAGTPANGTYDFRLGVFDDETAGDLVGVRVAVWHCAIVVAVLELAVRMAMRVAMTVGVRVVAHA